MTPAPTLTTQRLTLRPYKRSDFDAYAAFMASDRTTFMGGPFDAAQAWSWFTNDTAAWALYGFGTLAIEVEGTLAGGVGLVHPPEFPEPECGWFIFAGHAGHGYATEAGRAILDYTFATTRLPSIVSYISAGNAASVRVSEKLGGVLDTHAKAPEATGTLVYRYTRISAQRSVT